jgi:hypothetical protein
MLRFVRQDEKNSKRPVLRQLGEFEIMQKVWFIGHLHACMDENWFVMTSIASKSLKNYVCVYSQNDG